MLRHVVVSHAVSTRILSYVICYSLSDNILISYETYPKLLRMTGVKHSKMSVVRDSIYNQISRNIYLKRLLWLYNFLWRA